jgi:uncharacterized C2H2 Zn-finger protein
MLVAQEKLSQPYVAEGSSNSSLCPACGEEYRGLVDAIEHFAAAHPERTGGFAREFDLRTRTDYWRSWQGYVCPRCGRLSEDPTKHSCGGGEG